MQQGSNRQLHVEITLSCSVSAENCDDPLDHAMIVVGYGEMEETNEPYWLLKNSWGDQWGENGFLRLKRWVLSGCAVIMLSTCGTCASIVGTQTLLAVQARQWTCSCLTHRLTGCSSLPDLGLLDLLVQPPLTALSSARAAVCSALRAQRPHSACVALPTPVRVQGHSRDGAPGPAHPAGLPCEDQPQPRAAAQLLGAGCL